MLMRATDPKTSHYDVSIRFVIVERNAYNDQIGEGSLTFTKSVKTKSLAGLGQMFERIDQVLSES